MTEEAIKSFVEKLSTDETFANKLASAATPEERLKIANDAGFAVSASDLSAIKTALSVEELSDEDLEKVAGGIGATAGAAVATGYATATATAVAVAAAFI